MSSLMAVSDVAFRLDISEEDTIRVLKLLGMEFKYHGRMVDKGALAVLQEYFENHEKPMNRKAYFAARVRAAKEKRGPEGPLDGLAGSKIPKKPNPNDRGSMDFVKEDDL